MMKKIEGRKDVSEQPSRSSFVTVVMSGMKYSLYIP